MGWWSHASQESGEDGGRVWTLILQRQNQNVWTGTKDVEAWEVLDVSIIVTSLHREWERKE